MKHFFQPFPGRRHGYSRILTLLARRDLGCDGLYKTSILLQLAIEHSMPEQPDRQTLCSFHHSINHANPPPPSNYPLLQLNWVRRRSGLVLYRLCVCGSFSTNILYLRDKCYGQQPDVILITKNRTKLHLYQSLCYYEGHR
jgi:hypothetical protein